jgi:hypothetical protein
MFKHMAHVIIVFYGLTVTRTVLMIVVTPLLQPSAHLELCTFATPVSMSVFVFTH